MLCRHLLLGDIERLLGRASDGRKPTSWKAVFDNPRAERAPQAQVDELARFSVSRRDQLAGLREIEDIAVWIAAS